MSASSPKQTHVCDQCARAFSRAEHLERHQNTHLPSSTTKQFRCTACGKGFTRKDVLTRHIRAVHETKKSPTRKSRRKSCRRCATFKIKCTGGSRGKGDGPHEPCDNCKKRDVECIFEFGTLVKVKGVGSEHDSEEGSDRSESETTGSPDYSVKRRKIDDSDAAMLTQSSMSFAMPAPTAEMSPHLLSAARDAADSYGLGRQRTFSDSETTTAEQLFSMATTSIYRPDEKPPANPGLARAPVRSPSFQRPDDRHVLGGFPPIRGRPPQSRPGHDPMLQSIAEEDLNAANTLQGIRPNSPLPPVTSKDWPTMAAPMRPMISGPNTFAQDYQFPRLHITDAERVSPSSSVTMDRVPVPELAVAGSDDKRPGDGAAEGYELDMGLEDNWFLDYTCFDNSTDWLRDWGGDGPSPEATETEAQPAPSAPLSTGVPDVPSLTSTANSVRELSSPKSVKDEDITIVPEPSVVPGIPSANPMMKDYMKDYSHNNAADLLPWGWQNMKEDPNRRVTLPPLQKVLRDCASDKHPQYGLCSPVAVTDDLRNGMLHALTAPCEKQPYPVEEGRDILKAFPAKELLSSFLELYFETFHAIMPIIHRPTFCLKSTPSILLIAMVSIGASYSSVKDAKVFADNLSQLCKRSLTWMSEHDPAYSRSAFFLQALCLQNVYAVGSGNVSLYDAADVSRSILIGNARRIGLFSGFPSVPGSSSAPSSPRPGYARTNGNDDIETRWRSWIAHENLKRLAWGIFEYDSSFSTLSNRRGAITLSDISIRMPCAEILWEAQNAATWHAYCTSCSTVGQSFYPTLQDVISNRTCASNLTSWAKRLCAQAINRIMWDFKELEESVSCCSVPSVAFKPAKENLLLASARICEASRVGCNPELEVEGDDTHNVLARLISHYTHLHAAFPTVQMLLSIARRPPGDAPFVREREMRLDRERGGAPGDQLRNVMRGVGLSGGGGEEDLRPKRLKKMFSQDPAGSRNIAFHAAQILALSCWKPVFSPVEGMRIFLSGIVLWGFAMYFREGAEGGEEGRNSRRVRLDLLPWERSPENAKAVDEWVKHGTGRALFAGEESSATSTPHASTPSASANIPVTAPGLSSANPNVTSAFISGQVAQEGQVQVRLLELCGEEGADGVLKSVKDILEALKVWGLGGEYRNILEERLVPSASG